MNAKERYLAVFDEDLRKKIDYVPKFIQYVTDGFIEKNKQFLNLRLAKEFLNMTYFSVPFELGFDAVFAPFPQSVKVRSIKLTLENGDRIRIGEDGQRFNKKSTYYEGGFINSLDILDRLKSNMKIVDNDYQIKTVLNKYEKISKNLFPILMIDGIFDRVWKSMGIVEFSKHYRSNSKLYRQIIKFYAEILELNITKLIEATKDQAKIINVLDDVAYKGRLFVSPNRWKIDILPFYENLTSLILDSGIIPQIHSDGNVTDLIPLIQKAGFQGLQGWEGGCDPFYINEKFPKFVIIGFGDVSHILPYGKEDDVIKHVQELMSAFKKNRHFIIGPSTVCYEKIPLNNIQTFNLAATKYGKY